MANHIYMQLTDGGTQVITGDALDDAFKGWMELTDINTSVSAPRDMTTGKPTGKRTHSPITCFMRVDRATPELHAFCIQNRRIPTAEVVFYRSQQEEGQELYFQITLQDVYITAVNFDALHGASYDNVSFVLGYRAIEWRHVVASRTCVDDLYQRAGRDVGMPAL